MPNSFFTSDTHFNHANIIKYCNRPFQDVREMDEQIILRWNQVVGKNDDVYHLGDFAFGDAKDHLERYLDRLNGRIFLILGNHDRIKYNDPRFGWISRLERIKIARQEIILCHYSMRVWDKSHHGAWHLYGHSHSTLPELKDSLSFDVGVDGHNFYPWSFDQIKEVMSKKTWKPVDHHGTDTH